MFGILKMAIGPILSLFKGGKGSGVMSIISIVALLGFGAWNWWEGKQTQDHIDGLEQQVSIKEQTIREQKQAIADYKDSLQQARIEQQDKLREAERAAKRISEASALRIQQILQNRSTRSDSDTPKVVCEKTEGLIDEALGL